MIRAIEVSFGAQVELSEDQERRLYALVDEIARANTPAGCVHWLSGMGHKPLFSQADARFLGKPVDATAPETGEPTFDDSILALETYCREE
jgi:hypothetical protein